MDSPVRNLRFTESLLRLFGNQEGGAILGLGAQGFSAEPSWGGSFVAPWMRLAKMRFTSASPF